MTDHRPEGQPASPSQTAVANEDLPTRVHRSSDSNNASLEQSIDALLERVRESTTFSTTLQYDGWEPIDDGNKARDVLKIVESAVNKALECEDATHIVVSLSRKDDRCEVSVRNDGSSSDEVVDAFAGEDLQSVDECVRSLGGSIGTEPRVTKGTAVRLRFPI